MYCGSSLIYTYIYIIYNFYHQSSLHFSLSLMWKLMVYEKKRIRDPRLFLCQSIIVNRSIFYARKFFLIKVMCGVRYTLITYLE